MKLNLFVLLEDKKVITKIGINSVAIMSNDTKNYPEDSFENMDKFAKEHSFNFPYLIDKDQKIARPRQVYTGYEERDYLDISKR